MRGLRRERTLNSCRDLRRWRKHGFQEAREPSGTRYAAGNGGVPPGAVAPMFLLLDAARGALSSRQTLALAQAVQAANGRMLSVLQQLGGMDEAWLSREGLG